MLPIPNTLNVLLDEAIALSSGYSGGYSNEFWSAEEFHEALKDAVSLLREGDESQLHRLWVWFAPTCSWDDLIGIDGERLANKIHEIISGLLCRK